MLCEQVSTEYRLEKDSTQCKSEIETCLQRLDKDGTVAITVGPREGILRLSAYVSLSTLSFQWANIGSITS